MNKIEKHSFEAVSLLTAANGMLAATVIPALNQPDWIVPSSLILDSIEYKGEDNSGSASGIKYYSWQQQQIAVFHLLPKAQLADSVVILEGNSVEQRLALKTIGQPRQIEVSISEVQDCELPQQYSVRADNIINDSNDELNEDLVSEDLLYSYLFQAISIDDTVYMVPDLDKIAHQLVTLNRDSGANIDKVS